MAKEMPDDLTIMLAKQIKQLRLSRRWTREDLASKSGVNVYTLKHFERSGQISLERLLKVCQSLDILEEIMRAFKPRQRIDVDSWVASSTRIHQRGRRRSKEAVEIEG